MLIVNIGLSAAQSLFHQQRIHTYTACAPVISGTAAGMDISCPGIERLRRRIIGCDFQKVPRRAARGKSGLNHLQHFRGHAPPAIIRIGRQRQKLGLIRDHARQGKAVPPCTQTSER